MINYAITFLAVLFGYIVTVACAFAGTLALTSASPAFAVANHRVRPTFKLVHETLWLFAVIIGALATAWAGMAGSHTQQEILLVGVLLFILWRNTWEARQRGTAHQILISLITVVGVGLGFSLFGRLFHH